MAISLPRFGGFKLTTTIATMALVAVVVLGDRRTLRNTLRDVDMLDEND